VAVSGGDLEVFAWFVLGALALVIGAVIACDHEKKPKDNVRLPRKTAWDRASRYYEDRS
jgi:hypothetical protein